MLSFRKFVTDKFMGMTDVEVKELKIEADLHGDWWDEISDGERAAIETGLKQMEQGKTTPHEMVMQKHSKMI